ncbi:Surface polysaccharide O-acyltransferase, integral membrane enzyme [Sphingomonas laterariae]|uniref:Surface polysaccharide O-acyltransferase, integral membrane enzyme n=1 Tax=Edaphosphingomonas laterariae TaxID=861865 RepID=A0A239K6K2_9SPHN|nr:acyltransferase [Sphingomonas laterariae]SNT13253.1 Surface polysaccharide O-acyltransferase, integral membrane enzyme [Sphingomonas laterariae]
MPSPDRSIGLALPSPSIAAALPANLDTVRGLACLLLVIYHVVGNSPARGLELPADSAWHYATDSFALIRMPVFTILSGLLYGRLRVDRAHLEPFAVKKLRRLAIPLIVLTILTWSIRSLMGEESVTLGYALTHAYEHFWFLQALLWVFAFIAIADVFARPSTMMLAVLVAATALLSATTQVAAPFSLEQALYLLPFFLFGLLLSQCSIDSLRPERGFAALAIAGAIMIWQQAGLLGLTDKLARDGIPAFICGSAACVALLALSPRITWLETIGRYSYTIYLWHIFFLAGTREALLLIGVREVPLLFFASASMGLIAPILLHHWATRREWSAVLLLGIKPKRLPSGRLSA